MASTSIEVLEGRARSMVPTIADAAVAAERNRQLDHQVVVSLEASGLLSAMAPTTFGGAQHDPTVLARVIPILGEACASTAWVASFYMIHTWMAALLPIEGQRDLFGPRAHVLAPGVLSLGGRARRDGDDLILSGRWPFGTGAHYADWILATATVDPSDAADPAGPTNSNDEPSQAIPHLLAFPASAATLIDTWHVDGMAGTGSVDIVADEVRIPAHRSASWIDIGCGDSPGAAVHDDPLYRLPLPPMLALAAAAPAVGVARAALAAFVERIDRPRAYASSPGTGSLAKVHLARATVELDLAHRLLRDTADELAQADGPKLTVLDRARLRTQLAVVVDRCKHLVRSLCDASGASAHHLDNPLQRASRDLAMMSAHVVFDIDSTLEMYGRVLCQEDPDTLLV